MIRIIEEKNLNTLHEDDSASVDIKEIKEELEENLETLADIFMKTIDTVAILQKLGMKSLDNIKLPTTLIGETKDLLKDFISENPTQEDADKLAKANDEIVKLMGNYLK